MKKKSLLVTIILLLIAVFAFSLTACDNGSTTLETLKNEYGIVVDGGSFEEGSTLVSNEIVATTEEAAEVLEAIADQNYNKEGSVYIFDIYVTKGGVKVQPDGKVTVSIPIPNAEVDNYLVFHVKDDNSVENLAPTVADGKITFETSSFSYFVIAEAAVQDAPPIHVHNYQWVAGTPPTCQKEGIVGHYHCGACGVNANEKYEEIESVVAEKGSHDVEGNYSPRVEPTFFTEGTVAYYTCNDCLKYIDEDGQIIPAEDITIPAWTQDVTIYVNDVGTKLVPILIDNGSAAEWELKDLSVKAGDVITIRLTEDSSICLTFRCDGNIIDTILSTDKVVMNTDCDGVNVNFAADHSGMHLFLIDPSICEHNYEWVEGTEPTCKEEGVVGHYHCEYCGKNFNPNYGEIESISIPKAEHEYGEMYYELPPNFFHDGNIEYYQCSVCEKYFDAEYNEVETPVIPKYSTNISICVNGTPTALVLGEQYEGHIIWTLDELTVKEGDVITLCQTDNPTVLHTYFAGGIVDTNGKITMSAVAKVVVEATDNGLMLDINYIYEKTYNHYVNHIGVKSYDMTLDESNPTVVFVKGVTLPAGSEVKIHALLLPTIQDISYVSATLVNTDQSIAVKQDGYFEILSGGTFDFYFDFAKNELTIVQIDKGIVIEINGVQYPMNYVIYSDEQTTGYIYGLVNFAEDDTFVVVDKVNNIIYDYDDLCATYAWNTWDFHRGDNGEFVIDNAGRYGIEFDGDITKEIYINKHFAPLDGGSYEVVIEGNQQGVSMQQTKIPEGSEAYDGVVWYYKHESMMNVDDILAYIEEKGLYTYTASVTLAVGSKLNIKNLSVNTVITADHLTEVYANDVCLTKEGDYVKILSEGVYFITYLPAYNAFSIQKSEEELPDAYIYCDVGFVALTKDANNVVTYEGLVAEANDYVTFFDGTKTKYLPITLDSNTDSTLAHIMTSEGLDMLFFDKAGTYNIAYNVETGVLSITSVGGDTDQGGDNEQGGSESIDDYIIYISVVDYTNGNQTLYPTKNPNNPNEVYIRVETIAANSYLSVSAMSKADYSSTTYGTLAETDASVATNLTADTICVKVAGPIEVYFNFETKTIRIVAVS